MASSKSRQVIIDRERAKTQAKEAEDAKFREFLKENGYDISMLPSSSAGVARLAKWKEEFESQQSELADEDAQAKDKEVVDSDRFDQLVAGFAEGEMTGGQLMYDDSLNGSNITMDDTSPEKRYFPSETGQKIRNLGTESKSIKEGSVTQVGDAPRKSARKVAKKKSPKPLGPDQSYDATRTDKDGNVTKGVLIGARSGKMLYSFDPKSIAADKRAKAKYKSDMESGVNYGRSSSRPTVMDRSEYQDERSRQYAELYKNGSVEQQRQRKQKADNAANAARNIAANKKFYADQAAKNKITDSMASGVAPAKADLDAAGMTEEDYKNSVAFDKAVQSSQVKDTASNFAARRNRDKRTRRIR